jgi:cytochrome d ubiquinol oxidase subunit II
VLGPVTAVLALGFLIWTQSGRGDSTSLVAIAVVALVGAIVLNMTGREGWSFTLSGVTVVAAVGMLFLTLFPDVMPSSLNERWSVSGTLCVPG